MTIFWEKSENEKYWIYKFKRPVLWYSLMGIFFISAAVSLFDVGPNGIGPHLLPEGVTAILFLFGILGLFVAAIINFIEGGFIKNDIRTAKLRGKEVIIKGRGLGLKNPIEKWVEK